MRTRFLHLAAGNLFGGVESFLLNLGRAAAPDTHAFAVFHEGRLAQELRESGCHVRVLGAARLSRPWSLVTAQRALRRLLRAQRPGVVLCHSTWLLAAAGAALLGERRALFCHGPLSRESWLDRSATLWPPGQVLANSLHTAASVPALFARRPVSIVPCPVPAPAPLPPGERERVRAELGVAPECRVIVQVSRMEAWKGHHLLLEALARLDEARPWTCWVVGGGQRPAEQAYEASVRRAAVSLGLGSRVRFLGERRDVPRLLAASDIFCQANTGPEPFGIVFVEAMHAGLPVLTTALGGARDVVHPDVGALAEPDPDALAAVLGRWLSDSAERARLGAAGRERARTLYAPETVLSALEAAVAATPRAGPEAAPVSSR